VKDRLRAPVAGEGDDGVTVEQVDREEFLASRGYVAGEAANLVTLLAQERHAGTSEDSRRPRHRYAQGLILSVLRRTSGS
jgi:hypothetical protein